MAQQVQAPLHFNKSREQCLQRLVHQSVLGAVSLHTVGVALLKVMH